MPGRRDTIIIRPLTTPHCGEIDVTTPDNSTPPQAQSVSDLLCAAHYDPVALGVLLEHFRGFLMGQSRDHALPGWRARWGDSALVQDVLLAACHHFPDFRGNTEAELVGWLRVILHRLALNHERDDHPLPVEAADGRPAGDPDVLDPGQVPPDAAAVTRERAAAVREALAGLPAAHRAAVDLRFHEGLPFDEIGRRLGRLAESARKLVSRALRELARRLHELM